MTAPSENPSVITSRALAMAVCRDKVRTARASDRGNLSRLVPVLPTLLLATFTILDASGAALAEPVTPWSVARTVRPDAPAEASSPPPVGGTLFGVPLVATPAARTAPAPSSWPSLSPTALPDARSESVAEPDASALNPLADGRLGALESVRARPLFARSRRAPDVASPPAVESVPEPVAARPSPPDLHLIGVVEGIDMLAAVLTRPGGERVTLHLGETIDAWTVSAIGPQSLTLREGDREQAYTVFASRAAEAVTRAPAAAETPEPDTAAPEADAEQ